MDVAINVPIEGTPVVVDLTRGSQAAASGYRRDGQTVHLQAPRTGRQMLIDFNAEGAGVFAERSEIAAERLLSVEEIIARHRLQQASQELLVQHYVARVRMEQHFRPTVADPGYDVVTDNRYFSGPDGVEWEELSFSVNGSHWGPNRPPFPLLQAEKVLSLPLQLHFGPDYRYRLDGVERVDGFDCYVVKFDPVRREAVALSRDRLDRPPDVRQGQGAGRPDQPLRAGRLQRRNPALSPGRFDRRASPLSVRGADGPPDRDDRRT